MEGWWAASYAVLWLLVLVLCAIVVALARQIGTLHLRLGPRGALDIDDEGPPLGEAPPSVAAIDLAGSRIEVGGPGSDRLVLFVSPGCLVCDRVLPALPVVAKAAQLEPLVVTDVDATEAEIAFAKKGLSVPIVPAPDVMESYRVPGTPYVVVLDRSGVVQRKGTVNNLEQMEGLVETATRNHSPAAAERNAI